MQMKNSMKMLLGVFALFSATACATAQTPGASAGSGGAFTITSTAFQEGAPIPLRNSAYGENVSPELSWSNAPAGTNSFALVLDDPDAGATPFVHWVIYNIPGTATGLPEGLPAEALLSSPASLAGTRQGLSGLRRAAYFGPRPPAGNVHHYNFRLYALSSAPNLPEGLNSEALMAAITPSILGQTTLIGTYQQQAAP
jgi:Raf kinase inhibitor-like YbhB/YbcL family protein